MVEDFFQSVLNLKNIQRTGWKKNLGLKNGESVADHSFSMALMSMILSDLHNLDTNKILRMALLHDLAESKIGDLAPDEIEKLEKIDKENKTMEKILNDLPSVLRKEYHKIWLEYQTRKSQESVFVHEIDKLEMAFQAIEYLKKGHSKKNLQTFINSAKTEIKNEHLRNILNKLLESMK